MAKITKIEPQKRKGRVNIFIDSKFSFGLSEIVLIDYGLHVGQEVTEKEIEKYKKGDDKRKCLEKAYGLLSVRSRSEKELSDRLKEKFDTKTVSQSIKKLKEYGYINDLDFAQRWVDERKSQKGKHALFYELLKKGISNEIMDKVFSDIDKEVEYESALALVKSKSKYRGLNINEAYKKVGSFLSRRGYPYDVVKDVISEIYTK